MVGLIGVIQRSLKRRLHSLAQLVLGGGALGSQELAGLRDELLLHAALRSIALQMPASFLLI